MNRVLGYVQGLLDVTHNGCMHFALGNDDEHDSNWVMEVTGVTLKKVELINISLAKSM